MFIGSRRTCRSAINVRYFAPQGFKINPTSASGTNNDANWPAGKPVFDLLSHPERFAQEALGHNSKAVHRAYANRALMKIPSLEDYEQRAA